MNPLKRVTVEFRLGKQTWTVKMHPDDARICREQIKAKTMRHPNGELYATSCKIVQR